MRIAYFFSLMTALFLVVACTNNPAEPAEEGMPPRKVEQVEEVTTEQDNIDDVVRNTPDTLKITDQ